MLDIKLIRQDPDLVKTGMKKRNKNMDAQIDEIEIIVSEPEDMSKILDYLVRG